jgi:hypothetical protein
VYGTRRWWPRAGTERAETFLTRVLEATFHGTCRSSQRQTLLRSRSAKRRRRQRRPPPPAAESAPSHDQRRTVGPNGDPCPVRPQPPPDLHRPPATQRGKNDFALSTPEHHVRSVAVYAWIAD